MRQVHTIGVFSLGQFLDAVAIASAELFGAAELVPAPPAPAVNTDGRSRTLVIGVPAMQGTDGRTRLAIP